jgi:hypothetical protein
MSIKLKENDKRRKKIKKKTNINALLLAADMARSYDFI